MLKWCNYISKFHIGWIKIIKKVETKYNGTKEDRNDEN